MTDSTEKQTQAPAAPSHRDITGLVQSVKRRAPMDAAELLTREDDEAVARVLESVEPSLSLKILSYLPQDRQQAIAADVTDHLSNQWSLNLQFDQHMVGRIMDPPVAVFTRQQTVARTIERIRELVTESLFTYVYVIDDQERLCGVVVMRDLMLADADQTLEQVMLADPFSFTPETTITDAMRAVMHRHYPVYPVCDDARRIIGLVQGYMLFEEQAFELINRPGRMVGVEHEERIDTPWRTCLKYRHPWLQLNLVTAFLAALVVGGFEATIEKMVVLAAFLPVLAGQSGNTGCQALAVTLRGLTLGEYVGVGMRALLTKEAMLGLANGLLVGIIAALAMYFYAAASGADALSLALVVLAAMIGSCIMSGMSGVLVPLLLQRVGADPVTASSIFVTTVTDICSLGLLLTLATILV